MRKYIFISFLLFLIYPVFAGDNKTFTNDDLEKYNNRPGASIEKQYSNTAVEEQPLPPDSRDKEIKQLKDRIENLEESLKVPPRTIPGRDCDVLSFSASKRSFASMNLDLGIGSIITKQDVTVHIVNKYGMHRWVKDFYIVAIFSDGTVQQRQMQPRAGDSSTTQIQSGDHYISNASFDGDTPIVSVGCIVNPGL